jgi:hypothetical protein
VAVVLLIALFGLQAGVAAHADSVTIDEFVHLPVGLYALETGDFGLDPINPHLPRMLIALPALLSGARLDAPPGTSHWPLGYAFMGQNAPSYQRLFVRARLAAIAIALLLGLLVSMWATQLYGWPSGLAALGLFAFSPSMLAHAHLVTLDLPGALGFTACAFAAWHLLERPGLRRAVALGVTLGLAILLKLSASALVPALIAVALVRALRERDPERPLARELARFTGLLAASGAVALLVVDLGYGLQGVFAPLADAELRDAGALAQLRDALPGLRLPLPLPLLEGLDLAMNVGAGLEPSYFLAGELSAKGWWYYHLAAFALKTPLPLLVLGLWACVRWCAGRSGGRRDYALFVPILTIFAANALFNSQQIGVRHVLAVYPLLFVAASPLIAKPLEKLIRARRSTGRARSDTSAPPSDWARAALSLGLVAWLAIGSLLVAPRYLQYFHELAGGPAGGHRWLVDSNLDWGQDLIRLRRYMEQRGIPAVHLAYFGRVDPSVYGVRFLPLEPGARGLVVVSASFLMGRPYFWVQGGAFRWMRAGSYTWLQQYEPVARVGSLFLFDLEPRPLDGIE